MKNELLILTSPPASGKTYWIKNFVSSLEGEESLMVVSPLRALADECKEAWEDKIKIVTPEEWPSKPVFSKIVIFDEFHLNFYWGDSFRPILWETFYALAAQAELCILLTATLSEEMKNEIEQFHVNFDQIFWINRGNRELKYFPVKYLKLPSKDWMENSIELNENRGTSLIFCQYRNEVYEWEKRLKSRGHRVWTCVGGESKLMRLKMASEERPDFIVATTVLSHGVNLPSISRIYFLYSLKNVDFWIQMVARGGRKGENFEVFALERPFFIKWNVVSNFFAVALLGIKLKIKSSFEQVDQWFMKELL